jgi:O-antigen/teichoic acid export membrane protein
VFVAERVQRLVGAARRLPVPEGTWAIGAGLVIAGLSAYGFQIVAAKRLSDTDYAALNVLWAIVFVVTPGLFQPLEQEVARALAARRARGIGGGPVVRKAAQLGGILALVVILGAAILYTPIVNELFNGRSALIVGLFVAVAFYYVAFMTRGTLSGNARFGPYGLMHGTEGAVRIFFVLALGAIGVSKVGWYGLALAVPPIIAVAVSLRGQHGLLLPGPDAPYSELSGALALLLLGSALAQLLSYASVLGVQLLATPSEKTQVAKFITALFVARIPLLLFQAVQAALLPKLSGLASEGKHDDFRVGMKRLMVVVVALCVIGTVGATLLGPSLGAKLFPDKWDAGYRDVFLLTLAATLFIVALTIAQGLIALKAYKQAAFAWIAGIVAFVATVAAGNDLFLRNELGFVAGSGVAAILMSMFLIVRMRRGGATLEDLVEVVEHEPLEI